MVRHLAGYYPDPHDCSGLIGAVGLTGQASTRLRRLSGGQRRRVDLALGLVGRPELLVLDEPTTGLDPAARRQFWGLIRHLADAGTTVLLSTHYLDEAEALASRVAVVAAGRIVAAGPAGDPGRAGCRDRHRELAGGRPSRAVSGRPRQPGWWRPWPPGPARRTGRSPA